MSEQIKSVITCDLDGKLETFSEGAASLFGYNQEEVVNKMRVSDFSDGQVVLGHVVGWLAEAVKNGSGKEIRYFSTRTVVNCLAASRLHLQKEKMVNILGTAV